jgi:hypothetical protein
MTAELVEREIDLPHIVERELMCIIRGALLSQPRSQQVEIGASEIGIACTRKLVRVLERAEFGGDVDLKWKAYIGSCVHAGLADAVEHCEWQSDVVEQARYLVEHEVEIANVRGRKIKGHIDVFDIDSGTVVDWKIVGKSMLAKYRKNGPGQQYRVQGHTYGLACAQLGYVVRNVMVVFLPREEDLSIDEIGRATGSYVSSQAFDKRIAEQALSRIAGLLDLLDIIGADELVEMYPLCDDYFCDWCKRDRMRQRNNQERQSLR